MVRRKTHQEYATCFIPSYPTFDDNSRQFNRDTKQYTALPPLLKRGRPTFEFIRRYRQHYQALLSGNNYDIEGNWEFDNLVSLLHDAGLADFWLPPLLHYREIFGEERIVEFLRKLENKFCGDWIARETPTTRIEAMNGILKRFDRVKEQYPKSKERQIESLLTSDVFDFNKREFLNQLDVAPVYGRRFARYILYKLDMIYGGKNNRIQPPKEISVEHILPQNPADDSEWSKDFTPDQRIEWTDRLGNLVLISRRKNTSQGRLDYDLKKSRYFRNNIETFPNSLRVLTNNSRWAPDALISNHNEVLATLEEYIG